jgi:hypothetical protein
MITSILNNMIWFEYKGDEVAWNGEKYLSLGFEGYFDTLEQLDKFWEDYFKALGKSSNEQNIQL